MLAEIRFHPGEPVTVLAQRVLLDHTSLTRNLDLLERKGLVRSADGLERERLFQWILAWAGLSAIWLTEDGEDEHVEAPLLIAGDRSGVNRPKLISSVASPAIERGI